MDSVARKCPRGLAVDWLMLNAVLLIALAVAGIVAMWINGKYGGKP